MGSVSRFLEESSRRRFWLRGGKGGGVYSTDEEHGLWQHPLPRSDYTFPLSGVWLLTPQLSDLMKTAEIKLPFSSRLRWAPPVPFQTWPNKAMHNSTNDMLQIREDVSIMYYSCWNRLFSEAHRVGMCFDAVWPYQNDKMTCLLSNWQCFWISSKACYSIWLSLICLTESLLPKQKGGNKT